MPEQREPVVLVLLPVAVGREIEHALQPPFAVAQHLLECSRVRSFRVLPGRATR